MKAQMLGILALGFLFVFVAGFISGMTGQVHKDERTILNLNSNLVHMQNNMSNYMVVTDTVESGMERAMTHNLELGVTRFWQGMESGAILCGRTSEQAQALTNEVSYQFYHEGRDMIGTETKVEGTNVSILHYYHH